MPCNLAKIGRNSTPGEQQQLCTSYRITVEHAQAVGIILSNVTEGDVIPVVISRFPWWAL